MSSCEDTARALYLELRAEGLEVRVEDNPDGGTLDYGIAIGELHNLPELHARSLSQRVLKNEDELVQIILDRWDPDLEAIRREVTCR